MMDDNAYTWGHIILLAVFFFIHYLLLLKRLDVRAMAYTFLT